jgi:hypothetical protein
MAPSAKATKDTGQDDVDQMFAGNDDGDQIDPDYDPDDLLNQVDEDDSEGWVPTEKGEGIAGVVVKIGQTRSDFADPGAPDEEAMCPTVTIRTKDGTKWRVIGYGAVLKRELRDADLKIGDTLAVKYFGERLMKKGRFAGKPYKHFGVAVRRATANA